MSVFSFVSYSHRHLRFLKLFWFENRAIRGSNKHLRRYFMRRFIFLRWGLIVTNFALLLTMVLCKSKLTRMDRLLRILIDMKLLWFLVIRITTVWDTFFLDFSRNPKHSLDLVSFSGAFRASVFRWILSILFNQVLFLELYFDLEYYPIDGLSKQGLIRTKVDIETTFELET